MAARCWQAKVRRAVEEEEKAGIAMFQEFLRIPTISATGVSSGSYRRAAGWLVAKCEELRLRTRVINAESGKPIVVATWQGRDSSLPSLLLNSHYDVVPVQEEHWTFPPFGATRTPDGRIYARGAQDMKCVCIMYLLAIARLIRQGRRPLRDVHLSFVPDEENGGTEGMDFFLRHEEFKALNVGVALDEGLANEGDAFTVFYGERSAWWVYVTAEGPTGHGSRFVRDTAVSKLLKVVNRALEFRESQETLLGLSGGCKHSQAKTLGDVTTLNLTVLRAGLSLDGGESYAMNVIPSAATAGFDIRITPHTPLEDIKAMLTQWCEEAGPGVRWSFDPLNEGQPAHYATSTDGNPWWPALQAGLRPFGKPVLAEVFPAATDSRLIRALGVPAFGFTPMANSPILLHEHDEYIDEGVFLEGVDVYVSLIPTLANQPVSCAYLPAKM